MFIRIEKNVGAVGEVQFIEGIVALGKIKLNVYSFALDGILIDTGSPRLLRAFQPFFEKSNAEKVMLTHSHEDHVGGAAYLQKEYNLPVFMNESGIQQCGRNADYPFYRKFFWGKREPFHAEPIGETFLSRTATWDVIETPGHAEDHLSFLNRETGQLFSGDLFVTPVTKLILANESVPTIIDSIKHVLKLDFEEIFCCHAGYVNNGRKMLGRKLQYLEELEAKILEMNAQGYHEKEIQKELFKKKYPITYLSRGEWDSIHIIRSVLRDSNKGD